MADLKIPTETVTLPSKGLVYPETSPLAKGEIEMRYMSAKDEDILTNINFIKQGTAIDKLLKSLIITPIDIDDLIVGDKNAILFAARILGYGKDYPIKFRNESLGKDDDYNVDLTTLKEKEINESLFEKGKNEFKFTLPQSGNVITFKLLTGKDEKAIIIHLPAGTGNCKLVFVDIKEGWKGVEFAMKVRKWRDQKGLATPFE